MRKSDTNIRVTENLARRASDLARLMVQLAGLYEQLLALTERKLQTIRAADIDSMCGCNDEQEAILKRIRERDGLRKQLMDAIGVEVGMAAKSGRNFSVSQLLPQLPASACQEVKAARDRLRDAIGRLAQANRVSGAVSRELIHHLQCVFSAVRPAAIVAGQYSSSGNLRLAAARVFETIG
jgi:hypothetical protein